MNQARKRIGADAGTPAPKKRPQTTDNVRTDIGPGADGITGSVAERTTPVNYQLITFHTAGFCRPDPGGPGRWSWLALDDTGNVVAAERGELGAWAGMTEAYAGYVAVMRALAWAETHGARAELATDLPAVIAQALGRSPAPGALRPLQIETARRLAATRCSLRYVSPDRNRARQGGPA